MFPMFCSSYFRPLSSSSPPPLTTSHRMCVLLFHSGEILSHVDGTDRYTRMRYRRKVRGLTSEGHFDETHAALYFVDILHGLAYLHRCACHCFCVYCLHLLRNYAFLTVVCSYRNRICHRDLKPEVSCVYLMHANCKSIVCQFISPANDPINFFFLGSTILEYTVSN